jgi:hypothetical protein
MSAGEPVEQINNFQQARAKEDREHPQSSSVEEVKDWVKRSILAP